VLFNHLNVLFIPTLRKDSFEIVEGLTENIFQALGVTKSRQTDAITLNEFLITYGNFIK
jgi:hypothetical protein